MASYVLHADAIRCRNVKKKCVNFPPTSMKAIYGSSPNTTIVSASIRENGAPVIHCTDGIVYSYDGDLASWVKLAETWWAEGSDFWQGRQRGSASTANRGILSVIEGSLAGMPDESSAEKPRPKWWGTALSLGHLETRIHAAALLVSPGEYKQALLLYAKRVADEGFKGKAEELVKELFGPVYWCVVFFYSPLSLSVAEAAVCSILSDCSLLRF